MPRVTVKEIQQQIESLKSINEFQSSEITKLNIKNYMRVYRINMQNVQK